MSRRINYPPKWVHQSGDIVPLTPETTFSYTITPEGSIRQTRILGNRLGWYKPYRPINLLSRSLFRLGVFFL